MATVSIVPASGSIVHVGSFCKVSCADVASNDEGAYDANARPTEPELRYYFKIAKSGQDSLKSHVFSTNSDGTAEWNNVLIPVAGTWTLTINDNSDDSVVATASVVVS